MYDWSCYLSKLVGNTTTLEALDYFSWAISIYLPKYVIREDFLLQI